MELRVLRYFLAVVDEGSTTRAATAVRVAQPSLSRQLRQLEHTLGADLFDRSHGQLRLSAAGQQFLPLARDIVTRADAAAAALRAPEATRSVSLTLVAPRITVADVIGPFLVTLGPDALKVTVRESPSLNVFKFVLSGAADLGVSVGPPPGKLASCAVGSFRIWAQVPAGHPWESRSRITLPELVTEPLVLPCAEHGTRRLFDQVVAAAGLKYQLAGEAVMTEIVQALAAGGHGVAILTDDERYDLRRLAIDVGGEDLEIRLVAAWDETHYAAATIGDWAARLAEFTSHQESEAAPTPAEARRRAGRHAPRPPATTVLKVGRPERGRP